MEFIQSFSKQWNECGRMERDTKQHRMSNRMSIKNISKETITSATHTTHKHGTRNLLHSSSELERTINDETENGYQIWANFSKARNKPRSRYLSFSTTIRDSISIIHLTICSFDNGKTVIVLFYYIKNSMILHSYIRKNIHSDTEIDRNISSN